MIDINKNKTFGFPFTVESNGRITGSGGDDAIRGKIIQVLFTAPGERIHNPEFGCGIFNLVFEPNNDILAAAMEFTVSQALTQWMADEILVDSVNIEPQDETVSIEVGYTKRKDLSRQAVNIQFR